MEGYSKKTLLFLKSQHEVINKLNAPEVANILREQFSIFNSNMEGLNNFYFGAKKLAEENLIK